MAKKQSKKTDELVKVTDSKVKKIELQGVIDKIQSHNVEVAGKISFHLQKVKENTGEIQPDDISYVLGLATRELLYHFSKQLNN